MLIIGRDGFRLAKYMSVMLMAAVSPRMACAALGEPEGSVQADAAQMQASIKSSETRAAYRVHEIQLPGGTLLREFVSLDGNVFAVAWNGPRIPNLRQAFGKYFDSYVAGAKLHHIDHNHLQVNTADLVVQAGGHMRAYAGRAYLPASVPSGVSLGDLH